MPTYSVSANRSAGDRDYDVETLMWASSPRLAAVQFYRDWVPLGWHPGTVLVTDLEPDSSDQGPAGPWLFSSIDNLLVEEKL